MFLGNQENTLSGGNTTMGAEVLMAMAILEGISGVVEGNIAADEGRREAGRIRTEADIEKQDALKAADIVKEEGDKFLAEQALGFTASGVKLAGSPLDVLEETRENTQTEFLDRISRADNIRELRETQAKRTKRAGEQARTRGIVGGIIGVGKAGADFSKSTTTTPKTNELTA